ncbi:MAG: hypothetical protein HQL52_17505 [Magnetococcales bacterium]|nr:hypothetical protein [Magnetococcales bacterium]
MPQFVIVDPEGNVVSGPWEWSKSALSREAGKLSPTPVARPSDPPPTEPWSIHGGHTVIQVDMTDEVYDSTLETAGDPIFSVEMGEVTLETGKGEKTLPLAVAVTGSRSKKARPVGEIKSQMESSVNSRAESMKKALLTPGEGKKAEYESLREELERYEKDPDPDPTSYPWLAAGIGGDVPDTEDPKEDLKAAVAMVKTAKTKWDQKGAQIRKAQRKALAMIQAAATGAEAVAAAATMDSLTV